MPIVVTQNFSGSSLTKVSGAWSARESWIVTGVTDKSAAIDSAVSFDAPHYLNPSMRAGTREAEYIGPLAWKVTATFSFGDHGGNASSPLDEPARLIWEADSESFPTDTDRDGNGILNSSGDPFVGGASTVDRGKRLLVHKCLPFFNVSQSIQFEGAVNSNAFSIPGVGGVDPGQALLDSYEPSEAYTSRAPYTWVQFVFRFRGGSQPWQTKIVDKGQNGFYYDATLSKYFIGPFCDKGGHATSTDVMLNGQGVPINCGSTSNTSGWYVRDNAGNAQQPMGRPGGALAGMTIDSDLSSATCTVLNYNNRPEKDFSVLPI